MQVGIRWETLKGVPAEKVLAISDRKSIATFPFIKKAKFPVFQIVRSGNEEIIFFEEGGTSPLPVLADLERCMVLHFGLRPEYVVKTDEGFVSFKAWMDEVGKRIQQMPQSEYDTF